MKSYPARWLKIITALIMVSALGTACDLGLQQLDLGLEQIGKGKIVLEIARPGSSRTILPMAVPDPSDYVVTFTKGAQTINLDPSPDSTISQVLGSGTWTISITGRDAAHNPIASGSVEAVVSIGTTTNVPVTLTAIADSGTGWIDVSVSWPVLSIAVTDVNVLLDGVAVPDAAVTLDLTNRTVRYYESRNIGNYRLLIQIIRLGEITPVDEAVQVFANLVSTTPGGLPILLTLADFTNPPAAPSNLAVAVSTSNLVLTWFDNSNVEAGYIVERKKASEPTFNGLGENLTSGSTSYTDTTAVPGTIYDYRVYAFNALGYSAFSNVVSGTVPTTGTVNITITVVSPTNETITFDQSADIVVSQSSDLVVSVNEVFTSYEWWIDGSVISGATTKTLEQPCAGLAPGVHHVAVLVTKNGKLYSSTFRFIVGD